MVSSSRLCCAPEADASAPFGLVADTTSLQWFSERTGGRLMLLAARALPPRRVPAFESSRAPRRARDSERADSRPIRPPLPTAAHAAAALSALATLTPYALRARRAGRARATQSATVLYSDAANTRAREPRAGARVRRSPVWRER